MRTLSHPGRLAILAALRDEPACVCHLTTLLRRPQAYVSQQLAILRDAGLIGAARNGGFTYYHLRSRGVLGLIERAGRLTGEARPRDLRMVARPMKCQCPRCKTEARAGPEASA